MTVHALVTEGARFRPTRSADPVTAATKASLSSLAHRVQALDAEIGELNDKIESLLLATAPDLGGDQVHGQFLMAAHHEAVRPLRRTLRIECNRSSSASPR
jgi:hypothetical protein